MIGFLVQSAVLPHRAIACQLGRPCLAERIRLPVKPSLFDCRNEHPDRTRSGSLVPRGDRCDWGAWVDLVGWTTRASRLAQFFGWHGQAHEHTSEFACGLTVRLRTLVHRKTCSMARRPARATRNLKADSALGTRLPPRCSGIVEMTSFMRTNVSLSCPADTNGHGADTKTDTQNSVFGSKSRGGCPADTGGHGYKAR